MGCMFPLASTVALLLCFFVYGAISATVQNAATMAFDEGYIQLFGDSNLMLQRDGKTVHISLDERTGAGFASQDLYLHGFFSASIKLPSDYAAGVVVAFYMSNGDVYEKTHDELDFEFLGNIRGREWRVQTNVYGNGSTGAGREERYGLWFDPTQDFHQYSIVWTRDRIMFYIDSIPVREMVRKEGMGGDFPSKPMSLYATIWDGSNWATNGGRYKVNYKYAPYIAQFADFVLRGCSIDPTNHSSTCGEPDPDLLAMDTFRKKHMTYSYCHDRDRYPSPLPECSFVIGNGWSSNGERLRDRRRHHRHRPSPASAEI